MEISFSIAQTGLHASNKRQNVIADNIANLTTQGFKAKYTEMANLWGPGTRVDGVRPDFTPGPPQVTGDWRDIYVAGDGFLEVDLNGISAFTRDGSLRVDSDGTLTTTNGYILEPQITVPDDSVGLEITRDGIVLSVNGDNIATEIGQLEVTRFINPSGLISVGDNLWVEGPNSGDPQTGTPGEDSFPAVEQRMLEESNVDAAQEMAALIRNQRSYQLNLRVFQTSDELVGRAVDLFS